MSMCLGAEEISGTQTPREQKITDRKKDRKIERQNEYEKNQQQQQQSVRGF